MKRISLLILIILFFGCNKKEPHPYTFYYWRTSLDINNTEEKAFKKSGCQYLYCRLFDFDKTDNVFHTEGILNNPSNTQLYQEIIPVVFITNRTWDHITPKEIVFLAQHINDLIKKTAQENSLILLNEIQIDSDWTSQTKDDYFKFLDELKKVSRKNITCTIRPHQVKDQKETGIPPVKKGYLMCYSTSSVLDHSPDNSILEASTLKKYLNNINDYSLKLDVALPIYSWGIVTNHLGRKKIINALTDEELRKNKAMKPLSKNTYEILQDNFYYGMYLNKGFTVKIEEISPQQLQEVTDFLDQKMHDYHIVYYHLDSRFLKKYNLN